VRDYRKLLAYQCAYQLVLAVYVATGALPFHERFGLASQMRRAAASIPLNIAEGASRKSSKMFASHVDIAIGSSTELECAISLSVDLGYLTQDTAKGLADRTNKVRSLLIGLRRSLDALQTEDQDIRRRT
jgi:four helix bundle protein